MSIKPSSGLLRSAARAFLQYVIGSGAQRISIDDLARHTRISEELAAHVIHLLAGRGLLRADGGNYVLNVSVGELIFCLTEMGLVGDLEHWSSKMDWRDFEALVSRIFREYEYKTFLRVRVQASGRALEFDVIAYKRPKLLLIEVKRWRRNIGIQNEVMRHLEKANAIAKNVEVLMRRLGLRDSELHVIPALITLRRGSLLVLNGVPIVPITALRDFIDWIERTIDGLYVVKVRASRDSSLLHLLQT